MGQRHEYRLGLIGNCSFSALINEKANVVWMCWPRFDSSFVFGSLVGCEHGGEFSICPPDADYKVEQHYTENTNVLVTRFTSSRGCFEVIDFAPRFINLGRIYKPLMLCRKIRHISGQPVARVRCSPRGEYGALETQAALGSNHLRYLGLAESLRLTTNVPLTYIREEKDFMVARDFEMVLSWGIPVEGPLTATVDDFLRKTREYWWTWIEHCALPKVFQAETIRSALALKIHQYEDTGGIIAATTTSLPEMTGHGRNWDYRYCWIRDSYYSLAALNLLGQFEEVERYSHFIENLGLDAEGPGLQPVYTISGNAQLPEVELELEGYMRENRPVRVGNQAALQTQNDAYGQILLTLFNLYSDQRVLRRREKVSKKLVYTLLRKIEQTMDSPDAGIWEFRGRSSLHCFTLLFHWVGSAAAVKMAQVFGDPELENEARLCNKVAEKHIEDCYNEKLGAYVQTKGSDFLDASLLQMVTLGYFADKPMALVEKHVRSIERELTLGREGFLLRYRHEDDFGKQGTAFLICGFWLVESLIYIGEVERACSILANLVKTQNHLGLMSEGVDPEDLGQWGNFPQAYSHVGLINCAFALDRAIKRPRYLFT